MKQRQRLSYWRKEVLMAFFSTYRFRLLKLFIPVVFIGFIYWQGQKELSELNIQATLASLRLLQYDQFLLLSVLAIAAVGCMSLYDFLLVKFLKLRLQLIHLLKISWIANTFNNFIGFAGFAGATLRYLLYRKKGASSPELIRVLVFLAPAMASGLTFMSLLVVTGLFQADELVHEHGWMTLLLWLAVLCIPLYFVIERIPRMSGWFVQREGIKSTALLFWIYVISVLEWLTAGLFFALIVHLLAPEMPLSTVMGIFTIAALAGIISLAPGGVGAFDLTAMIAMQTYGIETEVSLAILLIFRFFYYFLPWILGLGLAARELIPSREQVSVTSVQIWNKSLSHWQKLWNWPVSNRLLSDFGFWALSTLVYLSGVLLLISAALPGILERLRLVGNVLPLSVMQSSHVMTVISGLALLVLSRGIRYRLRRAYYFTVTFLMISALFSITKGLYVENALFLCFIAILLWLSRSRFNRGHVTFTSWQIVNWGGLSFIFIGLYVAFGQVMLPSIMRWLPYHWQQIYVFHEQDVWQSALISLIISWLVIFILVGFKPTKAVDERPSEEQLAEVQHFLQHTKGHMLTHLIYLKDKSIYWAADQQVLISYRRYRDKLIALGDPIGPPGLIGQAIGDFRRFAHSNALQPVFYQVSAKHLSSYHDHGFHFFKLGEEAMVDLQQFSLSGKSRAGLRAIRNRFDREGFQFELVQPPFDSLLMEKLKNISDHWLGKRKEKGFSLGFFTEDYLQRAPIALLKKGDGHILAYMNINPCYDHGQTISVDLMRYHGNTEPGLIDALFLYIFEWAKNEGYRYFNLGMAPLSNVGQSEHGHGEEKIAHLVFKHGNQWYSFKGLRRFKEKYDPQWESKYLAYPQSVVSLPLLMVEIAKLISASPRKK